MEGHYKNFLTPATHLSVLGELAVATKNSISQGNLSTRHGGKKKQNKSFEGPPQFSERVKKLARKMFFKVKMYLMLNRAKKQVQTHLDQTNPRYSRLIRVLQNVYRSTDSAEFILDYIKQLSFFGTFIRDLGDVDDSAIVELCKCLRFEYIPAATCIFREKDVSNDKFYVILKGSVSFVKKRDANQAFLESVEPQQQPASPAEVKTPAEIKTPAELRTPADVSKFRGSIRPIDEKKPFIMAKKLMEKLDSVMSPGGIDDSYSQMNTTVNEETKQPEILAQTTLVNLIESLGIKVGEMHEGEGFGEKALLAKNCRRTASVVTNSNCDFIILSKKDYLEIITKYDKRKQAKLKFMKTCIPHLHSIASSDIWSNLFYLIREADYSKGNILGAEGAPGKNLYFIQDGYCDLEKTLVVSKARAHQKVEVFKMKRKLATFGTGSCLGEEILVSDDPKYEYTIVVSSIVSRIYYIDKASFMKRFPPECTNAVIEAFRSKEVVHKQKIAKFTEELDATKLEHTRESLAMQTSENLTQLMRPAMRQSMANHLKMICAQDRDKERMNTSQDRVNSVDSPHIQPFEDSHKQRLIGRPQTKVDRFFNRVSVPNISHDKSFKSNENRSNSPTPAVGNSRMIEADEINTEETPAAFGSRGGQRNFTDNLRTSPSFFNKRADTGNAEIKRSNKKILTIASLEGSQKSLPTIDDGLTNPFEKFDFGPASSAKSLFQRKAASRQEQRDLAHFTQVTQSATPATASGPSRMFQVHGRMRSPTEAPMSAMIKEDKYFGRPRLGNRGIKLPTDSPGLTPIAKNDDFMSIKTTEGTPMSKGLETLMKHWTPEETSVSETRRPKSHFSKLKVRTVEGPLFKNELENSKESLKLLLKNAGEVKKASTKLTIKDKRRIHDSLNTKKQKEKFNIKTLQNLTKSGIQLSQGQKIVNVPQGVKYQISLESLQS